MEFLDNTIQFSRLNNTSVHQYAVAERSVHGEDNHLISLFGETAFFGVFDGVGGHPDGAAAARITAEYLADIDFRWDRIERVSEAESATAELAYQVRMADYKIRETSRGLTTATVARILPAYNEQFMLIWVQVADSRLYHLAKRRLVLPAPEVVQLTQDEGIGSFIEQAVGELSLKALQGGYKLLDPGDKLLFTTDGVHGDTKEQLLTPQEIRAAINRKNLERAANRLVYISRKISDDATALVVRVGKRVRT